MSHSYRPLFHESVRAVAIAVAVAVLAAPGAAAARRDTVRSTDRTAPRTATTVTETAAPAPELPASRGTSALPALASGDLTVTINLAVDAIDVPAADRRLRVIALLSNDGPALDLALCSALFFDGTVRPIQGYAFTPDAAAPECTASYDHAPTLALSTDALRTGAPECPTAPPVTSDGDRVTVPEATMDGPGTLVLAYDYLLADIGDGLETLLPAEVLDRVAAGDGLQLDALTAFGMDVAAVVCPNGVDAFLAAAPPADWGTLATEWRHAPLQATGTVETASTMWGPASFGSDADRNVQVELEWSDNLDTPLADILTHDPEAGTDVTLSPESFDRGLLTATFPDGLPEGFRGTATVRIVDQDTTEVLSEDVHPFVVDTTAPAIESATTTRDDDGVAIATGVSDATSGLGAVRLRSAIDLVAAPTALMDYVSGDFTGTTDYTGSIAPAGPESIVHAIVSAEDTSGNRADAVLPVAAAGPDRVEECSETGGSTVTLDGGNSTFAPETEAATTFTWSNSFGTAEGQTADVFLPLGEHDITLTLDDDRGFTGTDGTTITVQDTTPPVIHTIDIPVDCLWPGNHKYVRFDLGQDILVDATDVCDDSLDIRIADVQSNQPDNERGDGNTLHDAVFNDGALCVRAERAGTIKTDRVYTITIDVADDSGNVAQGTAWIRVAHDQRGHDCPVLDPSMFVDDGDPVCALPRAGRVEPTGTSMDRDRRVRIGKPVPGGRNPRK